MHEYGVVTGAKETSFRGQTYKFAHSSLNASWYTHEDEASVREAFWVMEPGDIIFDVGCGFGSYTLPALATGAVQAYCWTPLDFEISVLNESLKLNGWQDKCELHQIALYSRAGSINPDTLAFSDDPEKESFKTTTLDEVTAHLTNTDPRCWLKMDVEGAELEVLKGGEEFIKRFRPIVFLENHVFKLAGVDTQVRLFLEARNYTHQATAPYQSVSHSLFTPNV